MNVLYLVREWPFVRGHHFFREVAWMRRAGHAVAIAALESLPPELDGRAILGEYGLDDVPELLLDDDPDPVDRILAFARRHGAQLIDAHDARRPAEIALEIHHRTGLPYTVRFHGGDLHSAPSPQLAEIAAHARALCPISRYMAELLTGERTSCRNPPHVPVPVDRDRLRVLPHGIPRELIAEEPAGGRNGTITIGTLSRLDDREKCGPFELVEAFAAVGADHPEARLLVIGGGDFQPAVEQLARERGVAERMTITGFLPWREAVHAASRLDIFVHGSDAEGFCLPVLEAAARGLPLAVTPTGVSEEIVDHGVNGYLYDYGDAAGLADRLRLLIGRGAEARRRMGEASLARVRERFAFDATMGRTERILTAAAEGAPLPP